MSNIIAIVWDFDKTLVNGYMQDPIFEEYGVDAKTFWDEVNGLPERYKAEGVLVNPDTIYLNHFIHYVKSGKFPGLNNEKLKEFGSKLRFYNGVPEIFESTCAVVDESVYREYDIRVEHYIVSTGMKKIIEGSVVQPAVENIWGCDFIEEIDEHGERVISEIGYTIDNTSKTRALFEINKGVHNSERPGIDVNTSIPEEHRRVQFINMVYVADGPSDIPSFSLVNKNGGATFAIYPRGDVKAMRQVEKMRQEGRVQMFAEADYSDGTTANMWLCEKVREMADAIRERERRTLMDESSPSPHHLV